MHTHNQVRMLQLLRAICKMKKVKTAKNKMKKKKFLIKIWNRSNSTNRKRVRSSIKTISNWRSTTTLIIRIINRSLSPVIQLQCNKHLSGPMRTRPAYRLISTRKLQFMIILKNLMCNFAWKISLFHLRPSVTAPSILNILSNKWTRTS